MRSLRSWTDALIIWGVFFLLPGFAAEVKGEEPTLARGFSAVSWRWNR